jgi:hypothetical protein
MTTIPPKHESNPVNVTPFSRNGAPNRPSPGITPSAVSGVNGRALTTQQAKKSVFSFQFLVRFSFSIIETEN